MKSIKSYISEGLFGNEEGLINSAPEEAVYKWLYDNAYDFISQFHGEHSETPEVVIKNGMIHPDKGITLKISDHVPSYIQFDKDYIIKNLYNRYLYDVVDINVTDFDINQKDVDRLGVVGSIGNVKNVKDLDIDIYEDFNIGNVKNIKNLHITYHNKRKSNKLGVRDIDIKNLINISVSSKVPVKLWVDEFHVDKVLNKDKKLTEHILKNLNCNYIQNSWDKYVFTDSTKVNDKSPISDVLKYSTKDVNIGYWAKL